MDEAVSVNLYKQELKLLNWILTIETYGSVDWTMQKILLRGDSNCSGLVHVGWRAVQDVDRRVIVKDMFNRISRESEMGLLLNHQKSLNP